MSLRISLLITFITITVTFVTSYTHVKTLENVFTHNEEAWSTSMAHAISEMISSRFSEKEIYDNTHELKEELDNIVKQNNEIEYAYIADSNNRIITHTFRSTPPENIEKLLNKNNHQQAKIADKDIINTSYEIAHGMSIRLSLGINQSPNRSYINKVRQTSIYTGITVGIIALALGLLFTSRVNQPLALITKTLTEIKNKTQLTNINLPDTGPSEIKTLSRAFTDVLNSRNEAQQDAINRQLQLNLLLNSTGECIYGIDTNGNATFANQACIKSLGFNSEEELLGNNMHELIHHSYKNGDHYPIEEC
ncbi:MAG: PAS domain-containing protein, partial [Gammaproteobacteria bacterium]|nr:PAS domain-containing protein [Gammaproteobacteria bacterium]